MNRWQQLWDGIVRNTNNAGIYSGEWLLEQAHSIHIRSKLTMKKLSGWRRVGDFYIRLIEDFEAYHRKMTELIEERNISVNAKNQVKYEDYKAKISAIIRARKRMEKANLASQRLKSFHLQGYMFQKRFKKAYHREESRKEIQLA